MLRCTLNEICAAVNGTLLQNTELPIDAVTTDSRRAGPGELFIPLVGERFDGHDFAVKAMELGAQAVITERAVEGARCIIVAYVSFR